jgi:hypothetical protein
MVFADPGNQRLDHRDGVFPMLFPHDILAGLSVGRLDQLFVEFDDVKAGPRVQVGLERPSKRLWCFSAIYMQSVCKGIISLPNKKTRQTVKWTICRAT